jgi:diguanylate cyclase (GGDEF)-like protein
MGIRKLWGRRSTDAGEDGSEAAPTVGSAAPEPADGARPREALAFSLRSWGQHAIEQGAQSPEEILEQFELWARQVLPVEPDTALAVDWDGLERFVLGHRKGEQRFVAQRTADLREALWAFVECFHRSLANDHRADARAGTQLDRLRTAIETGDTGTLRREALSAMQLLQSTIDLRQQRYRKQVELLSGKIARLSRDLVRAKLEASTDALTGLANRAAIDAHLEHVTQIGPLLRTPPLLLLIDIDHFKWVNDEYGHPVGDGVMQRVAARLRATFREADDFVARFGGDEFAVVVRDVEPGAELGIGERALFAVREMEVETPNGGLRCSISIGAARLEIGESPAQWLRRADHALYEAKRAGRDRMVSAGARMAQKGTDPGDDSSLDVSS